MIFWALGDSVLSLPMIEGLRKNFPESRIDVLANKRNFGIFYENKDIDNIIDFNPFNPFALIKLFGKYDICIDTEPVLNFSALLGWLTGGYTTGFIHGFKSLIYSKAVPYNNDQHMVQNYLDLMRATGAKYDTDRLVRLETAKSEKESVEQFLKENNISKKDILVGITPGVGQEVRTRIWPLDRMAELADRLIGKYNAKVIIIGGPDNKETMNEMIGLMKHKPLTSTGLNLRQVFYLIEKCKIYISTNTGPMHIAAAQQARTIGLFGPTSPVLWGPYGKNNIAIYHPPKCGCSPCMDTVNRKFLPCFNKNSQECMKNISVDEVFEAFENLRRKK
jgi:heptosyltransferase-2